MNSRLSRIVIASAVSLLAAAGLFLLIPAQTGDAGNSTDIAPSFFPNLGLGICLALGMLLLVQAVRGQPDGGGDASAEEEAADDDSLSGLDFACDIVIWIAGSVLTILMLGYAGFIPTGILLIAAWMFYCGMRSPVIIGLVAIGVPVLLERFCWLVLTIRLP